MKVKCWFVLALIVFTSSLSLRCKAAGIGDSSDTIPAGPYIRFDSNILDLGDMNESEVREGRLVLRNSGSYILHIFSVTSDCGCTVPKVSKTEVMPGDSSILDIRFSARGRDWGSFRKTVRIRSNAVNDRIRAFVKGKVLKPSYKSK